MNNHSRKIISSKRISLIHCDEELLEAILKGDKYLSEYLNIQVPNPWNEFGRVVFKYVLKKVKNNPDECIWLTYLPIDRQKKVLIGSCGYKGKPDENGLIELGYEVAKEYRNQGYATEITKLLVQNAFEDEQVSTIQAHTLAEKNASVRVLEKCNFKFAKELMDSEDGLIWKWISEK